MKNNFLYLFLLSTILVINTSTHKSNWPSSRVIDNEGKTDCIQFQFLRGSNRISDFKKVFKKVFKEDFKENNKIYLTKEYNLDDIIKIFGIPDKIINENKISYNLNPNEKNCVSEFNYSKQNHLVTCVTQDCY